LEGAGVYEPIELIRAALEADTEQRLWDIYLNRDASERSFDEFKADAMNRARANQGLTGMELQTLFKDVLQIHHDFKSE